MLGAERDFLCCIYTILSKGKVDTRCAIDIDENEVNDAKNSLPFCDVKVGSIYQIPYSDNDFNLVTCTEGLEHLEKPYEALEELYRVTNRYVVLSVLNEPIWRILNLSGFTYIRNLGNTPGHINHWIPKNIKSLLVKTLR
jgi:ubiquinone/menaquinone biosynthesis C-methylase UbiE